jgi:hypothetical protein
MIYTWFTCRYNYYKLAVEKERHSIFTTIWKFLRPFGNQALVGCWRHNVEFICILNPLRPQ